MVPTILIADFRSPQRELLHALLVRMGFAVEAISRASDALVRVESEPVRVLLCGLGLPNADRVCETAKRVAGETRAILISSMALGGEPPAPWDAMLCHPIRGPNLEALLSGWGITPTETETEAEPPVVELTELEPEPLPELEPEPLPELEPEPLPELDPEPEPEPLPELELEPEPAAAPPGPQPSAVPSPPVAPAGDVPHRGQIADYGLPHLIARLYRSGFSGELQLSRHGIARTIFFASGTPMRVDSTQLSETLGQLLVADGTITEKQYRYAQVIVEAEKVRLGEALIGIGALGESELLTALSDQTETKLVNSFAWRDGEFHIETDDEVAAGAAHNQVHPLRAIWRGVVAHYDGFELAEGLSADGDHFIVATELLPIHYETFREQLGELGLVDLLDGRSTVREALDHDSAISDRVAKALFVLRVAELIHLEETPGEPFELPTPTQSGAIPSDEQNDHRDLTELLARHLLFLKDADYFAALRLSHEVTPDQVDAAYWDQQRLIGLAELPPDLPAATLKQADEVRVLLFKAWETLRDPEAQQSYLATLARPAPPRTTMRHTMTKFERARLALEGGDFDRARDLLEADLETHEGDPAYQLALAKAIRGAAEQTDDGAGLEQAISCLERALYLNPGNVEVSLELVDLLMSAGRVEVASDHLARVLRCAPENETARAMMHRLQQALALGAPKGSSREKPTEIRHRLKVRCRQKGEKDALGYTVTVAYDSFYITTRTLYRRKSTVVVELVLPIVGAIALTARVVEVTRPPQALAAIQMDSGMRLQVEKAPDQWRVFIGSLKR